MKLILKNNKLLYNSSVDIAGFQFNHNGCVTNASGGEADNAEFSISISDNIVLGFSYSGNTIPSGKGVLLELEGELTYDCLSNFVFSDSSGKSIDYNFKDISEGFQNNIYTNNIYTNNILFIIILFIFIIIISSVRYYMPIKFLPFLMKIFRRGRGRGRGIGRDIRT